LSSRVWQWLDRRTGVNELLRKSLEEPIPGGARLAYVFGSALLFIFVSQVVTGICLAVYYVPSAVTAHVSVAYIVKEVAAGSFLRSLHSYGSSAMVVVLVLHFLQTFLYGSYKGKREFLWISGCTLSLLVLGMAFTGYLLPWDQKAYFASSVGTNIAGQAPVIGESIRLLLRGGATMGTLTISRFYVLHVFIIPFLLFLFVVVHIFLFRKAGAAGPVHEDPIQPRLPAEMFYPKQILIDLAFVLVVMGVLGMLAHFLPVTLGPEANPADTRYLPRPEWFYLPMFQWLKYWEGARTVIGIVIIPAVLLALFFLLPFLDRGLERRPWRRPIPLGGVLIVLLGLIWLGIRSHVSDSRDPAVTSQLAKQSQEEDAYFHAEFQPYSAPSLSESPTSAALDPVTAQGKSIFDSNGCNGCHGDSGVGGGIGPALTHVAEQHQPSQLVELLKAPTAKMKAGGMVPLTLNAGDMTALVSYLAALSKPGAPAAATPASTTLAAASPASFQAPLSTPTDTPAKAPDSASGNATTSTVPHTSERSTAVDSDAGARVFQSQACMACHGEGGVGTPRAPALINIGNKHPASELANLLRNPTAKMKAGGMTAFTATDPELNSLVAYLGSLKSGGAVAAPRAASGQAPAHPSQTQTATAGTAPAALATGAAAKTPPAAGAAPESSQPQSTPASSAAGSQTGNPSKEQGEALYSQHGCVTCHGAGGIGTNTAPALTNVSKEIAPAALANVLQHPTQKMSAGGMPPVNLSTLELTALVAYVESLGSSGAAPTDTTTARKPEANTSSPVQSPSSSNQAASRPAPAPLNELQTKGKQIFKAHRCADCHGAGGLKGTAAAPGLVGASFPPEVLTNMLRHPTTVMKKGGMPPVSLSDDELKALVAYISYISASKSNP
jgi:quinol-cytochrome oxidoreductase complex cytochrome b subunit/mono/diheme cytochrome c family protein